ncbi:MAG: hypothetical protein ACX93Q_01080 [Roseovarius sp.]
MSQIIDIAATSRLSLRLCGDDVEGIMRKIWHGAGIWPGGWKHAPC